MHQAGVFGPDQREVAAGGRRCHAQGFGVSQQSPQPLLGVFELVGATLARVLVTEIREHTYYAELYLQTANGVRTVSSRPSDALALAVRVGAEIYATEELLDAVGQDAATSPVLEDDAEESILDEFRDFIDSINPDDFT